MIFIQRFLYNDFYTKIFIQRFLAAATNDYVGLAENCGVGREPQKSLLAGSLDEKSLAGNHRLAMIFSLYNDF